MYLTKGKVGNTKKHFEEKEEDKRRSTRIICLKSNRIDSVFFFFFTYLSLSLSWSIRYSILLVGAGESEMTWSVFRSINTPTLDLSTALRSTRTPLVAAGVGCATFAGVSLFRMSSRSPPFASLSVSASSGDDFTQFSPIWTDISTF